MSKVVVFGLDGAGFNYMDPWLEEGALPNLARLIDGGVRRTLRSTFLPTTAMAWPSLLTGKNAGKHGLFDFLYRQAGSYTLLPAASLGIRGMPLHQYLTRLGCRVGMVNVPMTYPAKPVNGVVIGDFTTPEGSKDWTWPQTLPSELKAHGVSYPINLLHELLRMEKQRTVGRRIAAFVEGWGHFTRAQVDVVSHLLSREAYDFFMIVFSSTDHINHHTDDENYIRQIYEQVDAAVGEILVQLDDDTLVLVVSDHGSAGLESYLVLNRLLTDLGLIAFNPEVARKFIGLGIAKISWRYRHHAATLWSRLPAPIRRLLSWPLLRLDPRLRFQYDNIDWSKTKAYAFSGIGSLYINLKGREPHGIVEPGTEYEETRDVLIRALKSVRAPHTGKLLVDKAVRGEDVFHGPYLESAPDVVFTMNDPHCRAVAGFASDPLYRPSRRSDGTAAEYGYHTPEGIFIASGPGILAGSSLADAAIYDVAPTVLHFMNRPVPEDMDGSVMLDLFEAPQRVRYISPLADDLNTLGTELTDAERAEIEARLEALGYLE